MENNLKIKDLRPEARPYEKFLKMGPEALTDAELLAIILRTGSTREHSVSLAERLLCTNRNAPQSLLRLFDYSIEELKEIEGIGNVKAVQIKALCELSIRISKSRAGSRLDFCNPSAIAAYYMEQLRHLKREVVMLAMLNSSCELIKDELLFKGTATASLLSPREIFIEALKYDAVNIVVLHNHPSGNPQPSKADMESTQCIAQAGALIGIRLLDHIVIGDNEFISFKEKGYLNDERQIRT